MGSPEPQMGFRVPLPPNLVGAESRGDFPPKAFGPGPGNLPEQWQTEDRPGDPDVTPVGICRG